MPIRSSGQTKHYEAFEKIKTQLHHGNYTTYILFTKFIKPYIRIFNSKQKSELYETTVKEFKARYQAKGQIVALSYPKFKDYELMKSAKVTFDHMIKRGNENWNLFQPDLTIDLWPIIIQETKKIIKAATGGVKIKLGNETKLNWCYTEIEVRPSERLL